MLQKLTLLLSLMASLTQALPVRREVPQEHSHEPFLTSTRAALNLNNPDGIQDPVFALLGNAAASAGAGKITDANCLQQAVADRAFSNSKATGNVQGMVGALIFRALERNSGKVGQTTDPCTSITAVNPEIAAIQQHQDPASPNAAAVNKAIVLELARQINSVGGNPLDALKSGTFAPGNLNDPTARGNSCDDIDDPNGCIFTKNLLVNDATPEEISAAVGNTNSTSPTTSTTNSASSTSTSTIVDTSAAQTCAPPTTITVTAAPTSTVTTTMDPASATSTSTAAATTITITSSHGSSTAASAPGTSTSSAGGSTSTGSVTEGNLQSFNGSLGGVAPPAVTSGGRGFVVEGSESFLNVNAALGRSCDIQHNKCANIANSATGGSSVLTVGQCDQQNNACRAAISA